MANVTVRAVVTGHVQGVGFRMYTARQAQRLGISGWVRNRSDGSVELECTGDDEALGKMRAWLNSRGGVPGARVSGVDWTPVDDPADAESANGGGRRGFRVVY